MVAPVVPVDWVESVNDNAYLNKTQDEFMAGAMNQKPGSKFRNI